MFKKKNKNLHPILKHTPYLGSGLDKTVHRTENPCSDAYLIPIDNRWYIKSIPDASGYIRCKKCFATEKTDES